MALHAAIFDYGHTFLNFAPAEDRMLVAYEEIRSLLTAEAERELPQAGDLVQQVSRAVVGAVEDSYRQRQLEELDIVALFQQSLGGLGLDLPRELAQRIAEMEHRAMAADLFVPPENLQVLADLRDLGLEIGLVSNAHFLPGMMREDIERLGIAQYVDQAVFSSEIMVRKPHPDIFLDVLNRLEVRPDEAFFVGDRLRDDIAGAKALGMRAVLTRQFRQEELGSYPVVPDLVVDRLPDVVPWARSLVHGESRG